MVIDARALRVAKRINAGLVDLLNEYIFDAMYPMLDSGHDFVWNNPERALEIAATVRVLTKLIATWSENDCRELLHVAIDALDEASSPPVGRAPTFDLSEVNDVGRNVNIPALIDEHAHERNGINMELL